LPIFGRIAAGTPLLAPDQAIGYLETDRILINGKPYYVGDGDSNTVRLPFSSEISYVVLRVVGDSMDKAGIEEDDYVVLRVSARMALPLRPDDGDIVAVGLPPEGNEITLKRFRRREKKIAFEPESNNTMYLPYTFNTLGDFDMPIHVNGILVAVLKPLPE
jgi:SOS-response transcriptional repressor LexA